MYIVCHLQKMCPWPVIMSKTCHCINYCSRVEIVVPLFIISNVLNCLKSIGKYWMFKYFSGTTYIILLRTFAIQHKLTTGCAPGLVHGKHVMLWVHFESFSAVVYVMWPALPHKMTVTWFVIARILHQVTSLRRTMLNTHKIANSVYLACERKPKLSSLSVQSNC